MVVNNSFNAFDDDNILAVPILDLVVTSNRKLSNKFKNEKRYNIDPRYCSSSLSCLSSSCCSTHPSTAEGLGRCSPTPLKMGGDPKPTVDHEFVVNRNPDMATVWTNHRAIVNCEIFHGINVDLKSDHIITPIETIANSSLGTDGWALHDVSS